MIMSRQQVRIVILNTNLLPASIFPGTRRVCVCVAEAQQDTRSILLDLNGAAGVASRTS